MEEKTVPENQAPETAPTAPAEEKPELPSEIRLDPTEGSELHLSLASFQLSQKDVENVNLKIERAQSEVKKLEGERGRLSSIMHKRQVEFRKVMDRHNIPEGWSFFRQEDGSYHVRPPAEAVHPPAPVARPPMPSDLPPGVPATPPAMPAPPVPPAPPAPPVPPAPPTPPGPAAPAG